jgi:probable HAF family extracellular repeat protein
MVNIGTLGGTNSKAAPTVATAVNNAGEIVGYSVTATGAQHAFAWTPTSGMIDLGTLGGARSFATAVNNAGEVVGYSDVSSPNCVSCFEHAFYWTAATGMVDLGILAGDTGSIARGINDKGQIVGNSYGSSSQSFVWTPNTGMVALSLDVPGQVWSTANAINEGGKIVGQVEVFTDNAYWYQPFAWSPSHGTVILPAPERNLGTSGGVQTNEDALATAVNNAGEVVGQSYAASGGSIDAFVWETQP